MYKNCVNVLPVLFVILWFFCSSVASSKKEKKKKVKKITDDEVGVIMTVCLSLFHKW